VYVCSMTKKAAVVRPVKLLVESLDQGGIHVFLPVILNGRRCRFLLDTGASRTVVDHRYFLKHFGSRGLKELEQATTGLHSTQNRTVMAKVKELQLGGLLVKGYTAAAVDLGHVNATYKHLKIRPIHGILGSDLMSDFGALISYPDAMLHWTKLR